MEQHVRAPPLSARASLNMTGLQERLPGPRRYKYAPGKV